nr:uncharacterized protein LOC127340008 [Lolium perenne]
MARTIPATAAALRGAAAAGSGQPCAHPAAAWPVMAVTVDMGSARRSARRGRPRRFSQAWSKPLEKHLPSAAGTGAPAPTPGSWVVKELLLRGYRVGGTARDPADGKNAHLLALDGAEERLTLRRADLLNYDSLPRRLRRLQRRLPRLSPTTPSVPCSLLTCLDREWTPMDARECHGALHREDTEISMSVLLISLFDSLGILPR